MDYSVHDTFYLSYDGRSKCPNWVLEYLDKNSLIKTVKRDNLRFRIDTRLPIESRATPDDYVGSGFDIGHMAPAADHVTDEDDLKSTFVISNAVPQLPSVNRGIWNRLEDYVRVQAVNNQVWVMTCPVWKPDKNVLTIKTIGINNVWVPTHCAKSILIKTPTNFLIMSSWLIPNDNTVEHDSIDNYKLATDELEDYLGFNLWSNLEDDLQNKLERQK